MGSTEKMGTGMNVQHRAAALHHVDVPWRPADLEQREGRIIRQGNQNAIVEVVTYVTESTYDTVMWQKVQVSGSRRESHPPAPTDPGVTIARHRALVILSTRNRAPRPSGRRAGDAGG
jgi:hypothetical protein